jgi:DNA polymerase III sliding clamp (beta) subunit (PCNA family)
MNEDQSDLFFKTFSSSTEATVMSAKEGDVLQAADKFVDTLSNHSDGKETHEGCRQTY